MHTGALLIDHLLATEICSCGAKDFFLKKFFILRIPARKPILQEFFNCRKNFDRSNRHGAVTDLAKPVKTIKEIGEQGRRRLGGSERWRTTGKTSRRSSASCR
jgi:hypothetical protein